MARIIDPDLRTIQELLFRMADLADEQLADAVDALLRQDADLARRVRRRDDELDELELRVDHEAVRLLALHQPVALDLRTVVVAVKVNTDLERIGDYAKNLAKYTPKLTCVGAIACANLGEITDAARAMLRAVRVAYEGRDRVAVQGILARDARLDDRIDEAFEAVVAYGQAHPEELPAIAYLILALKAVERIGDHVKNIARSLVFLIEGEDIRHRREGRRGGEGQPAEPR